jgi:probable HAF family extracellular repeat protein
VSRADPEKEASMISVDNTYIRPRGLATIAAIAVCMALAVTGSLPLVVAAPPTSAPAEASTAAGAAASEHGHMMASHKSGSDDGGVRGHGFVLDNGVFTAIDAPGAGLYTIAFGIDESGKTVGGYVDDRGRLHGFLKDKEAFTQIDVPGAVATLASKINAHGQIVGAYSEERNTPAFALPHGFVWQDGVFTPIDVPGAQPWPDRRRVRGCRGEIPRVFAGQRRLHRDRHP